MINYTVLGKSVKFLLIPTISILILSCFITFSFTEPFIFITGDTKGAYYARFFLLLFEIGLTVYMYSYYLTLETKQKELDYINEAVEKKELKWEKQDKFDSVYQIFSGYDGIYTKYEKYKINDNLIVIKKHA